MLQRTRPGLFALSSKFMLPIRFGHYTQRRCERTKIVTSIDIGDFNICLIRKKCHFQFLLNRKNISSVYCTVAVSTATIFSAYSFVMTAQVYVSVKVTSKCFEPLPQTRPVYDILSKDFFSDQHVKFSVIADKAINLRGHTTIMVIPVSQDFREWTLSPSIW